MRHAVVFSLVLTLTAQSASANPPVPVQDLLGLDVGGYSWGFYQCTTSPVHSSLWPIVTPDMRVPFETFVYFSFGPLGSWRVVTVASPLKPWVFKAVSLLLVVAAALLVLAAATGLARVWHSWMKEMDAEP